MEQIFATLIIGTFLIGIIVWVVRTSERVSTLEGQVKKLRAQLAESLKPASAEAPAAEEESTPAPPVEAAGTDLPRTQFSDAKKRAVEQGEAKLLEPAPPPVEEKKEEPESPGRTAEPPPLPPPIPATVATTKEEPAEKPAPETREPAPKPPPAKPPFQWRPLLEKLNLWPPSGENAEATIGVWWLTRAGVIVGIIGAVFLGIRIAEDVSPWLRVLSLVGISIGVTVFGSWLERRIPAFGRLIAVGGLAIGYFTAFAAFALPATKIINDPVIGVLVQIVALAVMIGWSFWKNDKSVAAMAILLGYVSCGFSHHHDLDNYVIGGLLLLAAGGGTMLALRNWLWPHAVATAGSWGGFLILAIGKWSDSDTFTGFWLRQGEAPPFAVMLGSLLLLAAILEAANFLAEDRGGDAPESFPRERKWLSIINTSAAVAVGWIATTQVARDRLDIFFLSFAILLFAITALRYWRGHPTGLTETFFLKAIALLALFFVERFDGPTRWLSLAIEAGLVLWAWKRSRLRWVEIGFAAVFLGAVGFIWKDVLETRPEDAWKLLGIPSLAGIATLVLLSAELAWHSLWSQPESGTGSGTGEDKQELQITHPVVIFRFIGAAFIGFAASAFAFTLAAENPQYSQPVFLTLVALALAAPVFLIGRFPPIVAGLAALLPAYLRFLKVSPGASGETGAILTALWLAFLGIGLAEAAYRLWLKRWECGNAIRALLYGIGVLALTDLILRLDSRYEFGAATAVLYSMLFAAAGSGILIGLSRHFEDEHRSGSNAITHQICQWIISVLVGGLTIFVTLTLLQNSDYRSAWLTAAGAVLFAAAFRTRNHIPAAAGALPFLAGILIHTIDFGREVELGSHLLCALAILAAALATSIVLWRNVDREKHPIVRYYEFILQAAALFVVHWIFRSHLDASEVFFADALLAAGAIAAGWLAPFRSMPALTTLPLALALIHAGVVSAFSGDWGSRPYWWLAAAVVFGWIWYLFSPRFREDADTEKPFFQIWPGFGPTGDSLAGPVAAGVVTIAGFHALDNPWHLVVLTAFALILTALWRWEKIRGLQFWSALPLGVAVIGTFLRIGGAVKVDPTDGLIAASLTGLGITAHGVLIGFRNPSCRPLAWLHGLLALGLVFLAYAPGRFDVANLTTVCWGIASIVLFGAGLGAGLRPYRLAGLIGIAFCLVRMFAIDIEDPLYRIYAAFATAVVLLGMGYAYHRYRHLIERVDHIDPEED